jgi:hypothetical protein
MSRLKPIEPDDAAMVLRLLEDMATDLAKIANIIGPPSVPSGATRGCA